MKKTVLYLILILIFSLILQFWAGIVITGRVYGVVGIMVEKDITPPTILSYSIEPKVAINGENVYFGMEAIDNGKISSRYIKIITPANDTITSSDLPYTYNASAKGEYKVIFLADDVFNNTAFVESSLIVTEPVKIKIEVKGPKNKTVDVNFTIYYPNTSLKIKEVYKDVKNETISLEVPNYVFDLSFKKGDLIELKLKNINISAETEKSVKIDKLENPIEGHLVTYGIGTDYRVNELTLKVSYKGTNYIDENNLSMWKCEDWDFDNERCFGNFNKINAIQDMDEYTFTAELNNFSGFSIKETIVPAEISPVPYSSGGGNSYFYKGEKPKVPEAPKEKIMAKKPKISDADKKEVSKELPKELKKQFNKAVIIIVETPLNLLTALTFVLSLITAILLIHFLYKQYMMPMLQRYKS